MPLGAGIMIRRFSRSADLGINRASRRREWWWPLAAGVLTLTLAACRGELKSEPTPDPGNVLVIVTPTPGLPPPRTPTPVPSEQRYVVRTGDSLSAIAARFGVSPEAIQQANHLANPDSIYVGQELTIPPPEL